jgi:hypothetical protein
MCDRPQSDRELSDAPDILPEKSHAQMRLWHLVLAPLSLQEARSTAGKSRETETERENGQARSYDGLDMDIHRAWRGDDA